MDQKNFTVDYLILDEFETKQVLCMACGSPIKSRVETQSTIDPSIIVRELAKHPDYREIPVILSDNNIAFIMVCDNCRNIEISESDAELITKQINNAIEKKLIHEGKSRELVDEIMKLRVLRVIRKAEVHEAAKAFKGVTQ